MLKTQILKKVESLPFLEKTIGHLETNAQKKLINNVVNSLVDGVKYEEIHVHAKEINNSNNDAEEVAKKLKSFNRKKMFLTQNGSASYTWPFKNAADKYGLNFVSGLEVNFQNEIKKDSKGLKVPNFNEPISKLVIYAKNNNGYKAISRAISQTQDIEGKSYMDYNDLYTYFGIGTLGHNNVIISTGGIDGIICNIFNINKQIKGEISLLNQQNLDLYEGPVNNDYINRLNNLITSLDSEFNLIKEDLKNCRKLARKKLTARRKTVDKLSKDENKQELYLQKLKELQEDEKMIRDAQNELPNIETKKKKASIRLSALKKEYKALVKKKKEADEIKGKAIELKGDIHSDNEVYEKVSIALNKLIDIFGRGNVFAEIQYHGLESEKKSFNKLINLAKENNIPLVATNDVYILDGSDKEVLRRQMMRSLNAEPNKRWVFNNAADYEVYFKSDEQMENILLAAFNQDDVEEAMINTLFLSHQCNIDFVVEEHHPKYISESGEKTEDIFINLLKEGVDKKLNGHLEGVYRDRLNHEYKIMRDMGYIDYHLIVRDFNKYASLYDSIPMDALDKAPINPGELEEFKKENGYTKNVGLSTGVGRGSAVGSLVCDLLDITQIDPIKYNLYFERFLNPERVTMPDIDSDISSSVRPRVIEYIKQKYGEDCIAGITTMNAEATKGSIRRAGQCYDLYMSRNFKRKNAKNQYQGLIDMMTKKITDDLQGLSFDDDIGNGMTLYQYLANEFSENSDALKILEWAKCFEGTFTAYGVHAAGIVITDGVPVEDIVPLKWNESLQLYATQCDLNEVENLGMLKFDLLGLTNISIINSCAWELNKSGIFIDIHKIPLDDEKVFKEIFAKANTNSVFQFESAGMKQMLKRFKPTTFEDLILLVSMFRPGPMQYLDNVIDIKNGVKPVTYLVKELEPILSTTYGAIAYQEQVMQIFQSLAGYSLGQADNVRRAMSKKKKSVLAAERNAFIYGDESRGIVGCVHNNIDPDKANKLYDELILFSAYAFNKSHGSAYAYLAYITGYLKYYFPAEFLMAAMIWSKKKPNAKDPMIGLMSEAKILGVEVVAPDINKSNSDFIVENGKILFSLSKIKNVSSNAKIIIDERKANGPFKTIYDFFARCYIRKDALESLVSAGAFDGFYKNRKAILSRLDVLNDFSKKIKDKKEYVKTGEVLLDYIDSMNNADEIIKFQQAKDLPVKIQKPMSSEDLKKKIENAKISINDYINKLKSIKIPFNAKEDIKEKLNIEKSLLGAYVSANPLDEYPYIDGELENISFQTRKISGIINNLKIVKSRKTGQDMAFFDLEDLASSIPVNVFANSFSANKSFIAEGNVVDIDGFVVEDNYYDEPVLKFNCDRIRFARKNRNIAMIDVSSAAHFHIYDENYIIKKYKSSDGVEFKVYDQTLKQIRDMNYLVSESIFNDEKYVVKSIKK